MIFIVDDDPVFSKLISKELEKEDIHEVQVFLSAESFLQEIHNLPDIVVLDHQLPEII